MATKETKTSNMTTATRELKAVAKSFGKGLRQQGHEVPHSHVLHALAAALGGRDWHTLKASLLSQSEPPAVAASAEPATPAFEPGTPGLPVVARFRTDDDAYEAEFDCSAYLARQPDETLREIVDADFGGDYVTDDIAHYGSGENSAWCSEKDTLTEAFAYLATVNQTHSRQDVGFEVHVDARSMLTWMQHQRPVLLARLLCERFGIVPTESLPPPTGWEWAKASYRSTAPLATEELAMQDAATSLNLLSRFLVAKY